MCGILGQVSYTYEIDANLFIKMTNLMTHRGPDDFGVVFFKNSNFFEIKNSKAHINCCGKYNIALGFRRLSIQDTSINGHQPMSTDDGKIWIVFNGEFYNFKEYRKALSEQFNFKSYSDTEVILALYQKYGLERLLMEVNGMFAFGILDLRKNKLFVVRDRFGIKPLYYFFDSKQFIFASEIKSILPVPDVPKKVNEGVLDELLLNRFIGSPHTFFEGIKKLEPGHYLEITIDPLSLKKSRYFNLHIHLYKDNISISDVENKLISSLKYRLISDVPVGVFLSGGIDSSLLSALLKKKIGADIESTSIIFPENGDYFNEENYINLLANNIGIKANKYSFQEPDFEQIEKVAYHLEEPIADPAVLATFQLCKQARNRITVALSGEGSDEVNYGYVSYNFRRNFITDLLGKAILDIFNKRNKEYLKYNSFLLSKDYRKLYRNFISLDFLNLSSKPIRCDFSLRWWQEGFAPRSFFDVKPLIDFHTWLVEDLLLKVDKMSMAHGLEVRVPYLDVDYVITTLSMDHNEKISYKNTKLHLRKILKKYVPDYSVNRKQHGFLVPLHIMFKRDIQSSNSYLKEVFSAPSLYFNNPKIVRQYLNPDVLDYQRSVELFFLLLIQIIIRRFNLN